jgi:hypothetical protein
MNYAMPRRCSSRPFEDWDAWQIMLRAYQSLDFPQVPFDQSILNWRAKLILGNALLHLSGGYLGRTPLSGSVSIPDDFPPDTSDPLADAIFKVVEDEYRRSMGVQR